MISSNARANASSPETSWNLMMRATGYSTMCVRGNMGGGGGLCATNIYELSEPSTVEISVYHNRSAAVTVTAELSYIKLR